MLTATFLKTHHSVDPGQENPGCEKAKYRTAKDAVESVHQLHALTLHQPHHEAERGHEASESDTCNAWKRDDDDAAGDFLNYFRNYIETLTPGDLSFPRASFLPDSL